jgi:predicted unusual protein kinase regulating ubiquinone biosynthesis (AarF/ABC1/UbiB family)
MSKFFCKTIHVHLTYGNSYRVTLNAIETLGDEQEDAKASRLKACHKRCADRTLKVLERNGSIFIKLGQHLVSFATLELYSTLTSF